MTAKQTLPVRWEELTAADFPKAVRRAKGVCLLPIGVIEKHGPHLPLGTDVIAVRAVAIAAAEREYAVVFPWYWLGQIFEAKHRPGCIALRPELLSPVLQNLCDEIARNGLDKIVIVNGHGGNIHWLNFFCQAQLAERRPYVVYAPRLGAADEEMAKKVARRRKTRFGGHADEVETSAMMAIRPDLVKLGQAGREDGRPRQRLKHLPGVETGIWWYADFPDHYAGDAGPAEPALGELVVEGGVRSLAATVRAVKGDTTARALQDEFFAGAGAPLTSGSRRRS